MKQGPTLETAAIPQLEYGPGAAIGDLKLTRANGVTTIVVGASWRRVGQATWPLALILVPVVSGLAVSILLPGGLRQYGLLPTTVLVVLVAIAVSGWAGPVVMSALSAITFEAGPDGLTIRGRQWNDVFRVTFDRPQIADVLIERVRNPSEIIPFPSLVLILSDGTRRNLGRGSAAELAFLRRSLRDAWQLPEDPLAINRYPRAGRWWSTVSCDVVPGGVVVTIVPPWVDSLGVAILPVVILATAAIDWATVAPWYHMPHTLSFLGGARVGGVAIVCWVFVITTVRRLRWRATLSAVYGNLMLKEQSPLRPGLAEWPSDRIAGIRIEPTQGGRRADLILDLTDGSAVRLLTNGTPATVHYAHNAVAVALDLSTKSPTLPVQIPA